VTCALTSIATALGTKRVCSRVFEVGHKHPHVLLVCGGSGMSHSELSALKKEHAALIH
jgi:hypothetical protein